VDLEKETTCKAAFPAFVKSTSDMAWAHQTPLERETSLDFFCQTDCGQIYTETLFARRRGCIPPTIKGREGALVPNEPAAFPYTYPGLRLGCIIDPMDRQYCAMKRASPGDGECEFNTSCCCECGGKGGFEEGMGGRGGEKSRGVPGAIFHSGEG